MRLVTDLGAGVSPQRCGRRRLRRGLEGKGEKVCQKPPYDQAEQG
eukprot:COSAG01_NODE_2217_length_8153_cov_8.988950_2_plen_45_part_00